MDKSFEGLLFSVVVHAFLVWLIFFTKLPLIIPTTDKTEVTLIERPETKPPPAKKMRSFVTETETKPPKDVVDPTKVDADFLSQFTKRVKQQLRAANLGPTVNVQHPSTQTQTSPQQEDKRVAGMKQPEDQGEGETQPKRPDNTQLLRPMSAAQSSLSEYIPGVQEGGFTALNTNQFTYYTFFARMHEQVRNRWTALIRSYIDHLSRSELEALASRDRQTEIEIILGPEGKFVNAVLRASCGNHELDTMPSQAFALAAPFPNPPPGMFEPDGLIHLQYSFYLQFRPPSFGPAN